MTGNLHKLRLRFDDGIWAELICPDMGCVGSEVCGHCGRTLSDKEAEPCYDCRDVLETTECWVRSWFDNCTADELFHGSVLLNIDCTWDGDSMIAEIVEENAKEHS